MKWFRDVSSYRNEWNKKKLNYNCTQLFDANLLKWFQEKESITNSMKLNYEVKIKRALQQVRLEIQLDNVVGKSDFSIYFFINILLSANKSWDKLTSFINTYNYAFGDTQLKVICLYSLCVYTVQLHNRYSC